MKINSDDLPSLITTYLENHLVRDRGLSLKTRTAYADSLLLLLQYISREKNVNLDKIKFSDLNSDIILDFLSHLEVERGNTVRSRNLRLSAIKSFAGYVGFKNVSLLSQATQIKLIPGKKFEKGHIDYLTEEEIFAVMQAPDRKTDSGLRDYAMLVITYVYGLRVSEALFLGLDDVHFGKAPTIKIMGKGGREDVIPLLSEHVDALKAWLHVRPRVPSQLIFLNRSGSPLTRDGFAYLLSKYARMAASKVPSIQTKRVTPHVLRHSCAMAVLKATKDPRKAARVLRHKGYSTIEVYLHADPDEKLETIVRHPALGIKAGNFENRSPKVLEMLKSFRKN